MFPIFSPTIPSPKQQTLYLAVSNVGDTVKALSPIREPS